MTLTLTQLGYLIAAHVILAMFYLLLGYWLGQRPPVQAMAITPTIGQRIKKMLPQKDLEAYEDLWSKAQQPAQGSRIPTMEEE